MKRPYRVYKNGHCIAKGRYAVAARRFDVACSESNPSKDVVLLVTHFMEPINSF